MEHRLPPVGDAARFPQGDEGPAGTDRRVLWKGFEHTAFS